MVAYRHHRHFRTRLKNAHSIAERTQTRSLKVEDQRPALPVSPRT